jgi:hypothetical protein
VTLPACRQPEAEASATRVSSRWPCRTTFAIGGRCEPNSQVVVGAALRCWRRRRPTPAVGGDAEAPLQTLTRIVAGEDDPVDRRLQEHRTQTRLIRHPRRRRHAEASAPGGRMAMVFDSRSRGIWVRCGNRSSGAGGGLKQAGCPGSTPFNCRRSSWLSDQRRVECRGEAAPKRSRFLVPGSRFFTRRRWSPRGPGALVRRG